MLAEESVPGQTLLRDVLGSLGFATSVATDASQLVKEVRYKQNQTNTAAVPLLTPLGSHGLPRCNSCERVFQEAAPAGNRAGLAAISLPFIWLTHLQLIRAEEEKCKPDPDTGEKPHVPIIAVSELPSEEEKYDPNRTQDPDSFPSLGSSALNLPWMDTSRSRSLLRRYAFCLAFFFISMRLS